MKKITALIVLVILSAGLVFAGGAQESSEAEPVVLKAADTHAH